MQKTSFTGANAIPHPDDDAQEIVEALVILGGARMLGHVRRLVEVFRREGYPQAAARWDAIATIMSSVIAEEPGAEDLDYLSVSRLSSC